MTDQIATRMLDNGIRVFVRAMRGSGVVTVCAGVDSGSIHEQEWLGCGVSHYLEHLLFQGCAGFPGDAATRAINRWGGDFNAYTSYTHTVFYTGLPAENAAGAFDVLSAMLRAPEIPPEKFASEREVILRERDMRADRPGSQLVEALMAGVFESHPVRYPIIGYRELIAEVSREMLLAYHRRRYTPGRVFFVITGDIEPAAAFDAVAARLGDWPRAGLAEPVLPGERPRGERRLAELVFPDPQARLALGFRLPAATDPAIPAVELLAGLLGQNPSSVLIRELCRKRELATDFSAFAFSGGCPGVLGMTGSAPPERIEALTEALDAELARCRKRGFSAAELRHEQLRRVTDDRRELKSGRDWAFHLVESIAATGAPVVPAEYQRRILAVSADEVAAAADRFLAPEQGTLVVMRPADAEKKRRKKRSVSAVPPLRVHGDWSAARVVEYAETRTGLFELVALLPGGSYWEMPEDNGISQLAAAAWNTGAGSRRESAWHEWIDRHAIEIETTAGINTVMLRLSAPAEAEREAWEAWRTLLAAPRWDAAPVRREGANLIEELKSRAVSAAAVEERARRLLFGGHPFGLPQGDPAAVAALKPEALRRFSGRLWEPERVIFGVAGCADPARAKAEFAALSGALSWNSAPRSQPSAPDFGAGLRREEVVLDREQCQVSLLVPGIAENDPDRPALSVLLTAENGLAAHLFRVIREERSLAYSTGMGAACGRCPGYISLQAGCAYERAAEVAELLTAELGFLAGQGLSREEFEAARLAVKVRCRRWQEDASEWLLQAMFSEYYGRAAEALPELERRIDALTLDACADAFRRWFADPPRALAASVRRK